MYIWWRAEYPHFSGRIRVGCRGGLPFLPFSCLSYLALNKSVSLSVALYPGTAPDAYHEWLNQWVMVTINPREWRSHGLEELGGNNSNNGLKWIRKLLFFSFPSQQAIHLFILLPINSLAPRRLTGWLTDYANRKQSEWLKNGSAIELMSFTFPRYLSFCGFLSHIITLFVLVSLCGIDFLLEFHRLRRRLSVLSF